MAFHVVPVVAVAATLLVSPVFSATSAVSCGNCKAPKFHGRDFYLPFCSEDDEGKKTTHYNLCEAICEKKFTKGSCDACEKTCSPVFLPVCSEKRLYANKCHAKCANDNPDVDTEEFGPCAGGLTVSAQTRLPPNKASQSQGLGDEENKDEEI